jgi:multidrug resistance protein
MSAFTLTAQLSCALLNPAFVQVAKDLNVTVVQASYSTTVFMLFGGVFPLFITPFANVYGRRNLYLISTLVAIAGFVGSAASPSYGGLIAGRVIGGIGGSIPLGIGAATICDLFTQGERGLPMGIYAWATTNGPHIAPIAGGYIAQKHGWRWCIWTPVIIFGVLFIIALFAFPETLFSRVDHSTLEERSYRQKLFFYGRVIDRKIAPGEFFLPLRMIQYVAVTLPCIMYMMNLTYGSPLFAVTGSFIGASIFHFDLGQTGLFLGLPLTVGCLIGELSGGWVSDFIINSYARRHGGHRKAETRLYLLPLVAFTTVGVVTYGYCIENKRPWIEAAVCMAVAGFGSQISTTVVYTYCCDAYKPQSSEVSVIINLFKSRKTFFPRPSNTKLTIYPVYCFNVGFYALPIADRLGFTGGFGVLGALSGVSLIFPLFLIFFGEKIREKQGQPKDHSKL